MLRVVGPAECAERLNNMKTEDVQFAAIRLLLGARCRPLPAASSPNWRTRPPGWWQARQVSRLVERHATRSLPPRVVHSVCTRGGVAVRRKKSYHEVGIPQLAVS